MVSFELRFPKQSLLECYFCSSILADDGERSFSASVCSRLSGSTAAASSGGFLLVLRRMGGGESFRMSLEAFD